MRLASLELARGDDAAAEAALRRAVGRMQDFRAEGEFRALVGAEDRKEWKGEPYEKMMAFLTLGWLLLEDGDAGNALAMSKSAILADTGTSQFQYRSDFVAGFVLQALAHERLGERVAAEAALARAGDAVAVRVLTEPLAGLLADLPRPAEADPRADAAARALLGTALPMALAASPREPARAVELALSRATDLQRQVVHGARADRPQELRDLSRGEARRGLGSLGDLGAAWARAATDPGLVDRVAAATAGLDGLLDARPTLVLVVETGEGPDKVAAGRWGEQLRILPRGEPPAPEVALDGQPLAPAPLDSVSYQATTRGARRVDAFLRHKAVFKDTAPWLGEALLLSGDLANALREPGDGGAVAAVLYTLGAITWIAGAAANPRADTRSWDLLPDGLWLVAAAPEPGEHALVVDGRPYTVVVPSDSLALPLVHLVPALPPGGAPTFGGLP